ncbi:MAG: HAMP domain-containing histidine kinase [Defluviitaleaceae bacterium]|nr:HAMP domain-containing histidine kinase [Defluviitaleaceae bacterium]
MDTLTLINIAVFILILIGVICGFGAYLCGRYVRRVFGSIDEILERILAKKFDEPIKTVGENRLSKLSHKANRVMDMCISEVAQTAAEKETIQSFISDLSHQMKTPLAAIAMYTELLAEGGLSEEERQDFLSRTKMSTEKLQWLTENLTKISRLEVGAILLNLKNSSIKQTISEAVVAVLAEADKKNISIAVTDFSNTPLYHDKRWTVEALVNILENAIKYSDEKGEVLVEMWQLQQYSKITITNNGVGIPEEERHLIFKRFYRGENAEDKAGFGLGLYLANVIMEKQGGYIMVDSSDEKVAFSLFLRNCEE